MKKLLIANFMNMSFLAIDIHQHSEVFPKVQLVRPVTKCFVFANAWCSREKKSSNPSTINSTQPRLDPEVTFSGLKTWSPFGESKGDFEEARTCLKFKLPRKNNWETTIVWHILSQGIVGQTAPISTWERSPGKGQSSSNMPWVGICSVPGYCS